MSYEFLPMPSQVEIISGYAYQVWPSQDLDGNWDFDLIPLWEDLTDKPLTLEESGLTEDDLF